MFIESGVDMVRPSVRRAMFRERSDQNVVGVGSIDMALLAEGELVGAGVYKHGPINIALLTEAKWSVG